MRTIIKTNTTLLLLLLFSSVYATTFTVSSLADSGPNTLRQAIIDGNASGDNHIINFSVMGTITLASNLPAITKSFRINGEGITIDGDNSYYAILAFGDITLTINDLTIINCSAVDGPAVNTNTNLTRLNYCVFDNNSASMDGGAILSRRFLEINYCTISNNYAADNGGGLRLIGGEVTVTGTLFHMNEANESGGAAVVNSSGGVGGTLNIINSTLSDNLATTQDGGGVRVSNGNLNLTNVTITDNEAGDDGGGIMLNSPSSLTMNHTILAGNSAGDDGPDMRAIAAPTSNGYNIIGDDTNANFTPTTGDMVDTDPLLNPLANNGGPTMTHSLQDGSPAIDAGGPCQPRDQRRFYRTDGSCDIGAFEAGASIPTLSQWGLLILSLVLLITGVIFLKSRPALINIRN